MAFVLCLVVLITEIGKSSKSIIDKNKIEIVERDIKKDELPFYKNELG